MVKKVRIATVFLLAACLFSVYTTRKAEATAHFADIVQALDDRIVSIITSATTTRDLLQTKLTNNLDRFTDGVITRKELCKKIRRLESKADRKRNKFDRKIAKASRRKIRKLRNLGAPQTPYIDNAQALRDQGHIDKHVLYDTFDTAIIAAQLVATPCTLNLP
jgi:hypothetical protein